MPNHVTTICTVTGSAADVAAFVERHIVPTEDKKSRFFDFDTIIPKPACVTETTSGSKAEVGLFALSGKIANDRAAWLDEAFPSRKSTVPCVRWPYLPKDVDTREKLLAHLEKNDPEALVQGRASLRCLEETGHPDWYEWSIANWGTKWGAYDYEARSRGDGRFVFKFETAWSFPEKVFRKLAVLHPGLVLAVISYDEGSNFGCEGEFNGKNDYRCARELATDELYERVYGHPPDRDEDDEGDSGTASDPISEEKKP